MDLTKSSQLPQRLIDKYERDADRYWDLFYKRNEDRFFKDRHYFDREFPELLQAKTVLEVGCGVGNTIFPLLQLNPKAFVYACDFAPSAIALVRSHPDYKASGRVHAFVADITACKASENAACTAGEAVCAAPYSPAREAPGNAAGTAGSGTCSSGEPRICQNDRSRGSRNEHHHGSSSSGSNYPSNSSSGSSGSRPPGQLSLQGDGSGGLAEEVPPGIVDVCTMVFVLSAISPEKMPQARHPMLQAILNVARTLKPGLGQVLFRDYAEGDLAQDRLSQEGRAQRIGDNFYARWDGTRAFYFSKKGLVSLFESQGFRCDYVLTHNKIVENRKKQESMSRRYVQGVFTYCGSTAAEAQQRGRQGGDVRAHQMQQGQQEQHGAAAAVPLAGAADYVLTHNKIVENRKKQESMSRRYVQGVFTYCGSTAAEAQQRGRQGGDVRAHQMQQGQQEQHGAAAAVPLAGARGTRAVCGSLEAGRQLVQHCVCLGPVTFALAGAEPSPSELCLAHLLLASPALLSQRTVLELGGSATAHPVPTGLPSLAALRWCRFAVATAPSPATLADMRRNVRLNSHLVVIERLRLQQLSWQATCATSAAGNATSASAARATQSEETGCTASLEGEGEVAPAAESALLKAFPGGFDVIVGADVTRVWHHRELPGQRQEAARLVRHLAALLAPAPHAVVLLCQSRHSVPSTSTSTTDNRLSWRNSLDVGCSSGGSMNLQGGDASGFANASAKSDFADLSPGLLCVASAAEEAGLRRAPLPLGWESHKILAESFRGGVEILCLHMQGQRQQ